MIEPKSEYKKEFKSSPDRADALVLCFAQKTPESTVIRNFDKQDTQVVKANMKYTGEEKYCAMYYSKDLHASLIYASWDGHRVYVFDEYFGNDSIIGIATEIQTHQPLRRVVGNDVMFSKSGDCLEQRFRTFRVNVYENYNYNEAAAIETLNYMIQQKRLVLSDRCTKIIDQLETWKMDGSRAEQEHKFGLCYALCHLMSELKKKIDKKVPNLVIPAYTGEKSRVIQEISMPSTRNSWMLN